MTTTQNGVPIIHCPVCGLTHPTTRRHCTKCRRPSLFIRPSTGVCVHCEARA